MQFKRLLSRICPIFLSQRCGLAHGFIRKQTPAISISQWVTKTWIRRADLLKKQVLKRDERLWHCIIHFGSRLFICKFKQGNTYLRLCQAAVQHRVATDAPGGAFKIRPILQESLCHLSCLSSPGSRLNVNRWAAQSSTNNNFSMIQSLWEPCD